MKKLHEFSWSRLVTSLACLRFPVRGFSCWPFLYLFSLDSSRNTYSRFGFLISFMRMSVRISENCLTRRCICRGIFLTNSEVYWRANAQVPCPRSLGTMTQEWQEYEAEGLMNGKFIPRGTSMWSWGGLPPEAESLESDRFYLRRMTFVSGLTRTRRKFWKAVGSDKEWQGSFSDDNNTRELSY
jgi:hypothetical protein